MEEVQELKRVMDDNSVVGGGGGGFIMFCPSVAILDLRFLFG